MSASVLALFLIAVFQLGRVVLGPAGRWRLDPAMWLVSAASAISQFAQDGLLPSAVPLHVLLVVLGAVVVRRWIRAAPAGGARWRRAVPRVAVLVLAAPLVAVPIVDAAIVPLHQDDARDLSWLDAFDRLHHDLRSDYPLGRWKRVDWDLLIADHRPAVIQAERDGDAQAYYRAIRAYLADIPDGHLSIEGPAADAARFADIGGGFGFAALGLEDGRVIAKVVEPHGPAAVAGMEWGAEILTWDDMAIEVAIEQTPTVWASRPPATEQTVAVAKQQLLTRAPVGTARSISFRNPGRDRPTSATLIAVDDGYRSFVAAERSVVDPPQPGLPYHWLAEGIGYLRIGSLETSGAGGADEAMERAMGTMANADALILDTRGNRGGPDELVPRMMSFFTPTRLLYEHVAVPAPIGGGMIRLRSFHVEPNDRQFTGPVVVLVDHRTKSSGEGFALVAKQLPNAIVIGSSGTDGSFAMVGQSILLPTGIEVNSPWGLSVDDDNTVQVDGDHQLSGGIHPDVVVPMTFEHAESIHRLGHDVVLDRAIDWLGRRSAAPNHPGLDRSVSPPPSGPLDSG